jgi:hypothetical protein
MRNILLVPIHLSHLLTCCEKSTELFQISSWLEKSRRFSTSKLHRMNVNERCNSQTVSRCGHEFVPCNVDSSCKPVVSQSCDVNDVTTYNSSHLVLW